MNSKKKRKHARRLSPEETAKIRKNRHKLKNRIAKAAKLPRGYNSAMLEGITDMLILSTLRAFGYRPSSLLPLLMDSATRMVKQIEPGILAARPDLIAPPRPETKTPNPAFTPREKKTK